MAGYDLEDGTRTFHTYLYRARLLAVKESSAPEPRVIKGGNLLGEDSLENSTDIERWFPSPEEPTSEVGDENIDSIAPTGNDNTHKTTTSPASTLVATQSDGSSNIATNPSGISKPHRGGPSIALIRTRPAFQPSYRVTGARAPDQNRLRNQAIEAGLLLSNRYQGRITNYDIRNAGTPEYLNCSLYLTNIHPDANIREIFALIRTGKIQQFSLCPPEKGKHETCAAFLTFTNRAGAEAFYMLTGSVGGAWIHETRIVAVWNKKRIGPSPKHHQSRVVQFCGPANQHTIQSLTQLLKSGLYFEVVDLRTWINVGCYVQERIIEVGFASVRAQSESAIACFTSYFRHDNRYRAWYAPDPCDPASSA